MACFVIMHFAKINIYFLIDQSWRRETRPMKKLFLPLFVFILSLQRISLAASAYEEIYKINTQAEQDSSWSSPATLIMNRLQTMTTLSLLDWSQAAQQNTIPTEKYNRTAHFGRWINDPTDDSCFNTRHKVLERDSDTTPTTKPNNHCKVASGHWLDPYTNTDFYEAKYLQIDHLVPLKNAYDSGAWKWSKQMRCLYANYMGNLFHLVTVSGHENMSKSDKGPDQYMPPEPSIQCEYLNQWLAIKAIWGLTMPATEARSIQQQIQNLGCQRQQFAMTKQFLQEQRRTIQNSQQICPN